MTDQTDQNVTESCQFLRKQCIKTSVDLCRVYIDLCICPPLSIKRSTIHLQLLDIASHLESHSHISVCLNMDV